MVSARYKFGDYNGAILPIKTGVKRSHNAGIFPQCKAFTALNQCVLENAVVIPQRKIDVRFP